MRAIPLLVPGDPGQYTGGYIYDARIARATTRAGRPVETRGLAGRFPDTDGRAAEALATALADCPDGQGVIIDGLALGGLPDVVEKQAARLKLIALIHHPLADEFGIAPALAKRLMSGERRALGVVTHIVVTSRFTARHLVDDYGVDAAALDVVEPGVDKFPVSPHRPGDTPLLLCVATLVPRKGHAVLVDALSQLADLSWRCECIGDTRRDPDCVEALQTVIRNRGLQERIHLAGTCTPEALAAAYRKASLFVLPSYYEGYGMAVIEALANGLPVVTTTGGALAQTLPARTGITVPPGDATALAGALRRLLGAATLRAAFSADARRAAATLPDWDMAGTRFAAVLDRFIPERAR